MFIMRNFLVKLKCIIDHVKLHCMVNTHKNYLRPTGEAGSVFQELDFKLTRAKPGDYTGSPQSQV